MNLPPPAVLVIDDDPDFRELVTIVAEARGMEIVQAGDCASGLAVVEKMGARISTILLDYCMPGLEPTACAEALRQMVASGTSIVLVTAAVDARQRAAQLGITQWLSKPFALGELERLLDRRRR